MKFVSLFDLSIRNDRPQKLRQSAPLTVRYEFPKDVYTDRSLLLTIVVEHYRKDCSDSFAYIADSLDFGLVIFDYEKRESWRIVNQYFYPFPGAGVITIDRVTFDDVAGLFGLALGKTSAVRCKYYSVYILYIF